MIIAIGMDPGPHPGLVKLHYDEGALIRVDVAQCNVSAWPGVLRFWISEASNYKPEVYFGGEKFVLKGKYAGTRVGGLTRDQVNLAREIAVGEGVHTSIRPAVEVKDWATDVRLYKAGLNEHLVGMRHAKDAARHALFTAVKDGRAPDPLSRKAQSNG